MRTSRTGPTISSGMEYGSLIRLTSLMRTWTSSSTGRRSGGIPRNRFRTTTASSRVTSSTSRSKTGGIIKRRGRFARQRTCTLHAVLRSKALGLKSGWRRNILLHETRPGQRAMTFLIWTKCWFSITCRQDGSSKSVVAVASWRPSTVLRMNGQRVKPWISTSTSGTTRSSEEKTLRQDATRTVRLGFMELKVILFMTVGMGQCS